MKKINLKNTKNLQNQTRDTSYKSRSNTGKPIKPANRVMRMRLPHKKQIEKIYKSHFKPIHS